MADHPNSDALPEPRVQGKKCKWGGTSNEECFSLLPKAGTALKKEKKRKKRKAIIPMANSKTKVRRICNNKNIKSKIKRRSPIEEKGKAVTVAEPVDEGNDDDEDIREAMMRLMFSERCLQCGKIGCICDD
ncbi:hypothetical protein Dimus_006497 [Dionaea muscipula]